MKMLIHIELGPDQTLTELGQVLADNFRACEDGKALRPGDCGQLDNHFVRKPGIAGEWEVTL
jgi:hypothetical protein